MQQTEKYKLNLIESSDPFLPDALNANTQRIEAAMAAHEAGVTAKLSEVTKIAYGDIKVDASIQNQTDIQLSFTPQAILGLMDPGSTFSGTIMAIGEGKFTYSNLSSIEIHENGFHVQAVNRCIFIAFS